MNALDLLALTCIGEMDDLYFYVPLFGVFPLSDELQLAFDAGIYHEED